MEPTETSEGYCHVCGSHTTFRSYEPLDFPCKRNSFICDVCGSSARNRHIAKTILDLFPDFGQFASLSEFAMHFDGRVFMTCTTGAIAEALSPMRGLVRSEYIDGVPAGSYRDSVLCQDIQSTSFDDNSFDLVITEDVLEHVPFPERAFREIGRILKPGGYHVATIPVKWHLEKSEPRAILKDGKVVHLREPEYHLDPTRQDGILSFTDYGQDIVKRYCRMTGRSKMLEAHLDRRLEEKFAIYNNWVFLSQKRRTSSQVARSWKRYAARKLGLYRAPSELEYRQSGGAYTANPQIRT